jgi:hypothetical protein
MRPPVVYPWLLVAVWVGSNQVIRLFARAMYAVAGTRPVDPGWENRPRGIWQQYKLRVQRLDERFAARLADHYAAAMAAGKWRGTSAVQDPVAYWTGGVLAYFEAAGQDAAPPDAFRPIATRAALQEYDPPLYQLVAETMAHDGHVDWRL